MEAILVKDQKAAAFVMEDGTFEGVYRITEKVCGDEWESENVDRFLNFFCDTVQEKDRDGIFLTDGTILEGKALHPVAMTAVNAQAALASDQKNAFLCVHRFWETPLRTGDRRYYDNCLYFFAYLALSGNYRIY